MSVILPQIPARLRRMLGRFVGPAGAALFSLVLASCAGGGFGGAPDTPAVNPVSQPTPVASGPISPASQRNVAEALSGLKLGDETPPISPQDIAVSGDAEILNRNPFSSSPPAARASGWGARADSTRKTQGYKAFEVAVPSENPLMTVAVWISETPPDYPEGKPEQDPESDRKFLYLRLQVFIEVGHVALVEGGGIEVLDSEVIVVEEKRPDPKPRPVTPEAVTAETVCESGSLSANGLTQTELDEGLLSEARDNDLEGVCEYLRRGANVDAQESRQSFRRTALMIAATGGFLELAKLLHVNGGDVRHQGGYFRKSAVETSPGWSALHYAAGAGHAAIVSWLLDVGADIDARWYVSRHAYRGSKSVIMEAAYWGRPDVIKILLSRGADMNALWLQGHTPLHAALNLYGPNVTNVSHDTLMASYDPPNEDSYARALSLLASHASDVNARTFWGWSALDYAVHQNNARFAEILRGYGGRCFGRTGPLCGEVQVAVDFSSSGAGTVSAEGDDGALAVGGEVRQGATVMFTATPAAGRYVSGWSGNCAEVGEVADGLDGTAKSCAVSAASDLSVRAEFSEIPSLAGPLCPSGSLSANGLTQAELDAGLISAAEDNDLEGACEYLRRGANVDARESGRYYKRTALMIATTDGRLELAKLLYANGADVNLDGGNHDGRDVGRGWTALQYSGAAGRPELAGWLLDSGAELNSEWVTGKTALWEAAYWGRPDVVELLLSRGAETNGGGALLHAAVLLDEGGWVSARRYWANGPAFRYKRNAISYSYPTPTADEHGQVVSLLLSHDAEVNARYQGRSPLDYAVRQGDERLSAMLRDAGGICYVETGPLCGVDVAVDFSSLGSGTVSAEGDGGALSDGGEVRQGATVMFTATPAAGHYVSGWSGHCADAGEVADGLDGTAKSCAVSADSDLSVRVEFSEIPSLAGPLCPSGSLSANGMTQAELDAELLLAAKGFARSNHVAEVCEALRRGGDIKAQDRFRPAPFAFINARASDGAHRRTPLMLAAVNNRMESAKLLVKNGADVNYQSGGSDPNHWDGAGWSALMYAAGAGHVEMVAYLLDQGAEIDMQWASGYSALHEAALWARWETVELLIERGANVNLRDHVVGETPLHAASWGRMRGVHNTSVNPNRRVSWSKVIKALLDAGSEVNALSTRTSDWDPVARVYVDKGWSGGRTPLDRAVAENRRSQSFGWAIAADQRERALLLRSHGGVCNVESGPLCPPSLVAVNFSSSGAGTVSAEGDGGALSDGGEIRQGATVMFTATPAAGHYVSGWSGNCADAGEVADGLDGAAKSCAAAADSDLSVRAEFSEIPSLAGPLCPSESLSANGLTTAELNMTLRMAARGGDATRACEALRRGAEVNDNLDDSEFTPLQEAVSGGHLEAAKVLLANGAEVNKRKDGAGHSPLDLAARDDQTEIAALLRNADGRCFVETGPLCRNVPVATPDPVTVVNTVAATVASTVVATVANTVVAEVENTVASTVAAGSCPAGTLPTNGMTQAQLDYEFLGAVLENDLEGACEYLRQGANIEIREDEVGRPHNLSALMIAAGRGGYNYPDMTRLLLANGAKTDARDGSGWVTALHYAAASGHTETAALILDWGGDVNVLSSAGDPPLYQAAHWGRADVVQLLLSRGADPDIQADTGVSPLHGAASNVARSGSAAVVSLLLSYDADPNLPRSRSNPGLITRAGETGHSPLDDLVARGYGNYAEAARILRDAGGKCFVRTGPLCQNVPVATTPDPVTVVNTVAATVASTIVATVANTVVAAVENTVAATVAAGSCPAGTLDANGLTQAQLDLAMLNAVSDGDVEEVCEYLRRGANVGAYLENGNYGLALVQPNDVDMAKLLLENGADPNQRKSILHWPPLMFESKGVEIIRLYLSYGADPNLGSDPRQSSKPLHHAAYYNNWRVMEALLEFGAEPNVRDTKPGWRMSMPLHFVFDGTRTNSDLAVSVLLSGGADVNALDGGGNSALDLAVRDNNAAAAQVLRDAGGQCFARTGSLCGSAPAPAAAAAAAGIRAGDGPAAGEFCRRVQSQPGFRPTPSAQPPARPKDSSRAWIR